MFQFMKQPPSVLLPLLRSPFQGELLAWLFLHPDEEYAQIELAKRFGVSASTVTREVDRLSGAGLIIERRVGNLRMVRADTDVVVARPLTELLALTYGPSAVLGEWLADVAGVEEAYIYGSWAARYSGEPGRVPRDVDVLIIGDVDEDDLYDAARAAERRLGREVNMRRVSRAAWEASAGDPFLDTVRSRPLVQLKIDRGRGR
ncbi:ArsR family transcriptional regulator [Planotetraspora phitsanulokensis]|uniref:ArsR family transcriptional regulator n=2 Tax=Planotetraspora phitsanulokensis TaxID=575192 RepID=A0A8J3UFA4_9ACTN|nr:ArsR family transcriptional regulator [Planotetraspora phitsanulokensis]